MAKGVGFYNREWFSVKQGKDLLYESIIRILMTAPGERVMRPNFGVGLNRSLFEVVTPDILQDLAITIHNAINSYERRVEVVDVQTELGEAQDVIRIHVFMRNLERPDNEIEELTLKYTL